MSPPQASLADGLSAALSTVKEAIRGDASDGAHRAAYFQLLCVAGDWDRAADQLKLIEELDPQSALFAQVYYRAVRCEIERASVLRGEADPVIFGEPSDWLGHLIEAFRLGRQGNWAAADLLRKDAFEAAAPTAGVIDGEPIEWLADADSRFGPVLEAFLEGKYRWIPFERIQRITIEPPRHVIDAVWLTAKFTWTNDGTADGLIPVRYPASELSGNEAIQRARQTVWEEKVPGYFIGIGQKTFATDLRDHSLLDLRDIQLRCDSPVVA